jgi:hypothetical protein
LNNIHPQQICLDDEDEDRPEDKEEYNTLNEHIFETLWSEFNFI